MAFDNYSQTDIGQIINSKLKKVDYDSIVNSYKSISNIIDDVIMSLNDIHMSSNNHEILNDTQKFISALTIVKDDLSLLKEKLSSQSNIDISCVSEFKKIIEQSLIQGFNFEHQLNSINLINNNSLDDIKKLLTIIDNFKSNSSIDNINKNLSEIIQSSSSSINDIDKVGDILNTTSDDIKVENNEHQTLNNDNVQNVNNTIPNDLVKNIVDSLNEFSKNVQNANNDISQRVNVNDNITDILSQNITSLQLAGSTNSIDKMIDALNQASNILSEKISQVSKTTVSENDIVGNILKLNAINDNVQSFELAKTGIENILQAKLNVNIQTKDASNNLISVLNSKISELKNMQSSSIHSNTTNKLMIDRALGNVNFNEHYDTIDDLGLYQSSLLPTLRNHQINSYEANGDLAKQISEFNESPDNAKSDEILKISEIVKANAQSTIIVGQEALSLPNNKSTKIKDAKTTESIYKDVVNQIKNVENIIAAETLIDKNGENVKELQQLHQELIKLANDLQEKQEQNGSLLERFANNVLGAASVAVSGLGLMGLGSIFSLTGLASGTFERMAANGRLRQLNAWTDASIGADYHEANAYDRIYNMGKYYHHLTSGETDFSFSSKMYSDLAKNVGGAYGSNPNEAANDLHQLTRNFSGASILYGLDNSTTSGLLKALYKDQRMSVQEASGAIFNVMESAQRSQVPIEKYMKTITHVVSSLRNIGVGAGTVMNVMNYFTTEGMRVEDAESLVTNEAKVHERMASNWTESAYYGAMSGQSSDLIGNIAAGMNTTDAQGNPNNGYYGMMGKRVQTKYNMLSNMFGDSQMKWPIISKMLLSDGYDMKDASIIKQKMMSGDTEGLDQLFGKDNDEVKIANVKKATDEMNQKLQTSGEQLSKTQAILSDLVETENDLSLILEKNLGPKMDELAETFNHAISYLSDKFESAIKILGELLSSDAMSKFIAFVAENPLKTMFGVGLASMIPGLVASKIIKMIKNHFQKTPKSPKPPKLPKSSKFKMPNLKLSNMLKRLKSFAPSGSGSAKTLLSVLAIGGTMLLDENTTEASASQDYDTSSIDDSSAESSDDELAVIEQLFLTGEARVQLVDMDGNPYQFTKSDESTNPHTVRNALVNGLGGALVGGGALAYLRKKNISLPSSNTKSLKNMFSLGFIMKNLKLVKGCSGAGGPLAIALSIANEYMLSKTLSRNFTMKEHIARVAIDSISAMAGGFIGGMIGSPLGAYGFLAGSLIGSNIGSFLGDKLKDKLNLGDVDLNMDESMRKWIESMDENSDVYHINIMDVINSETKQGDILRNYFAQNEIDISTLNDTQKNVLKEMFDKIGTLHMSLSQALVYAQQHFKNLQQKNGRLKTEDGKVKALSSEEEEAIDKDVEEHFNVNSDSYDAYYYINEIANKRYSTLEEELNSTDYDHQDDRDKLIKQMDELSGIISYCEDIKNGNQNNAAAEAESENRRLMEEQAGSNPNDMGWSIFKNGINQVSADDISARWKKKLQDNLGSFKQEFKDNAKQEALEAAQKEEDSNKPEDDKPKNDVPQMGTGEGALNRAPAQYKPLIMKYSQENGVDPRLVAAIIETESGWNPNAISDAGAIGLGQFMPSTAESVGIDPTNPEQSIQGVAMHMKSLLGTFNNDSIKAIAAYNAGVGAVKDAGGVPNFAETQNYVKKVMAAISGSGGALNNSGGTGGLTLSSPQTPSQKMQTAETNYASLLGKMGAHTIKGRIINEMYVDQSQTYESINEINKRYDVASTAQLASNKRYEERMMNRALNDSSKYFNDTSSTIKHIANDVKIIEQTPQEDEHSDANTAILKIAGGLKNGMNSKDMIKEIQEILEKNNVNVGFTVRE